MTNSDPMTITLGTLEKGYGRSLNVGQRIRQVDAKLASRVQDYRFYSNVA